MGGWFVRVDRIRQVGPFFLMIRCGSGTIVLSTGFRIV
jgi:hypothetical protein